MPNKQKVYEFETARGNRANVTPELARDLAERGLNAFAGVLTDIGNAAIQYAFGIGLA